MRLASIILVSCSAAFSVCAATPKVTAAENSSAAMAALSPVARILPSKITRYLNEVWYALSNMMDGMGGSHFEPDWVICLWHKYKSTQVAQAWKQVNVCDCSAASWCWAATAALQKKDKWVDFVWMHWQTTRDLRWTRAVLTLCSWKWWKPLIQSVFVHKKMNRLFGEGDFGLVSAVPTENH